MRDGGIEKYLCKMIAFVAKIMPVVGRAPCVFHYPLLWILNKNKNLTSEISTLKYLRFLLESHVILVWVITELPSAEVTNSISEISTLMNSDPERANPCDLLWMYLLGRVC